MQTPNIYLKKSPCLLVFQEVLIVQTPNITPNKLLTHHLTWYYQEVEKKKVTKDVRCDVRCLLGVYKYHKNVTSKK